MDKVEELIAKLSDSDYWDSIRSVTTELSKRRDLIKELGEIGDARAVEPLIAELRDAYEDSLGRLHGIGAAEALGEIGDARAVEPLIARCAMSMNGSDMVQRRRWARSAMHAP